jgi:hypothetical protein
MFPYFDEAQYGSAEGLVRYPALVYPVGVGIDSLIAVYAKMANG